MKVLMIIAYPEFGGTETHVLSLARMLSQFGIKVGLATYGGPFLPVMRRHGVTIHKISTTTGLSSAAAASIVSQIAKQHGYTIVHAHDIESFRMLPYLHQRLPNVPLLITVHGVYYSNDQLHHAANAADLVIAVSPSIRKRVVQAYSSTKKVKWVPNVIDTLKYSPKLNIYQYRRDLGLPSKAQICLYAGRFQSDKWQIARKLILASEKVASKHRNFFSVLVGFGSYRYQLSQLAEKVNTRLGRVAVRVLPPTPRIEDYYRAATFVVGTGRVALEAMSCGKPVIAAGACGFEGIVRPSTWRRAVVNQFGDHGAPVHTTVHRLATDINKLLINPQLLKSTGQFGRRMVIEQFSFQKLSKTTYHVYQNISRG